MANTDIPRARSCEQCGTPFSSRSRTTRCEPCRAEHRRQAAIARSAAYRSHDAEAYRAANRERQRAATAERRVTYLVRCEECLEQVSTSVPHQRYCTSACQRAANLREKTRRRRAARFTPTIERFTSFEVFERDNWTCQLCGEKLSAELLGTRDPKAPELDHIRPLLHGGAHTRENTQCACLTCNRRKGATWTEELALAG